MKDKVAMLPPRAAIRFLEWFCPSRLLEGIEGDLVEQFLTDVEVLGEKKARLKFVWGVIKFFRPGIFLRNTFSYRLIDFIMWRNYLLVAVRNVLKNKVFSAINIFGLGIGLAACLLIFQFVSFELSYDKFNEKLDRTYRVTNDRFQHGKLIQHGTIMYPTIGPTMAKDFAEVEAYTRLMPGYDLNVKIEDKNFRGEESHFADEHFLTVFSYSLLAGDRATMLKAPYSMVLTEETAIKYFGVADKNYASILGKTLYWGLDTQPYKITGVCENIPENSHLQFDVLVSYATLIRPDDQDADNSWTWSDMRHYLVLKPGVDYKTLEAKFPAFSERYFQGDKVSGSVEKFYLQPLKDAHLYSNYEYDVAKVASGKAVWAMLVVAGFILLIAWINYINLTTSRAVDRAKEVGLRKVMGAVKTQLVRQFIFESVLISMLALVVALIIVQLVQKPFNEITEGNVGWWTALSELETPAVLALAGVMISGILLSGFYPAFILSSYQPATVLKGKFQNTSGGHFLRKALVVFQFTASAALITGTLIVSEQLKFMSGADLGINLHNTVIVRPPELTAWDSTFNQRVESYKEELAQISGVVSVSTHSRLPGDRLGRNFGIRLSGQSADAKYTFSIQNVDYGYFDTYSINVLAGRKFTIADHRVKYEDLNTVIINMSSVKLFGIENAQEAIGQEILMGSNGTRKWTIVGVINDFHQESLKNPMEAMIFRPTYSTYANTAVKLRDSDPEQVLPQIEGVFKKFFPGNSFDFLFLEDRYNRQYSDDRRFGKIVSIFTVLGIIISCLGLIGLSSYTAVQRTKEIGVRKVLGASILSIVSLLSMDFIKLVLVASVISLPVAYFAMQDWLTGYAYRISLGWALFLLPVFLVVLIAALTISAQVLKAAMANPAETLKCE